MKAEIVAVGTEIVLGDILNTNAQYLSQRAAQLGIDVYRHVAVGDNPGRMAEVFRQSLERADLVVVCGGLGPTDDDLSKEVMADLLALPLEFDSGVMSRIEEVFRRLGRTPTPGVRKQAYLPRGARILPNRVGTAPGLALEAKGKRVIMLPGPPPELTVMWEEQVEPLLRAWGAGRQVIFSRTLKICGLGESAVAERVRDFLGLANPTVAPYAKPGEVHLRLTAKATDREEAERLLAPLAEEIGRRLGWHLFGADEVTLPAAVGEKLAARGLRLAVAESCTGGMLGARLTSVPGSSRYFLGGVISYANEVKERELGVSAELLSVWGAVSEPVVVAMARGVRVKLGADLSLAISGIAGPEGGTPTKPVGTVWFALAAPEDTFSWREVYGGDREHVRERACQAALTSLYEFLSTSTLRR